MNLYEIIGQSWKTTWNYKILWIPGICLALISILYMPISLLTSPILSPFTSADFSHLDLRMIFIGDAAVILLLIFSLPIMMLARIINTLGAFHAKQGVEELSFAALLKESLTKFWRVLGIFLT